MKIKTRRGLPANPDATLEQDVANVPSAFAVAIPALAIGVSRGMEVCIECTDEAGLVFRIETPGRVPCKYDGVNAVNWTAHRKIGHPPAKDEGRFQDWLRGRPEQIQAVARRWHPSTCFETPDGILHVVGYGETDTDEVMLILSLIDPAVDYRRACEEVIRVCASHLDDVQFQPW